MKVYALLREKARPVHTIASNQSVDDAINLMTAKKASALIVMEDDQPVGIFAERDVFRYYLRDRSAALSEIALQKAMTDKLIVAEAEDDVSRVMAIMIKADIKHLPIIDKKKIIGMLKLNDLIEHQIESFTDEINQLKDYIEDLHEAGRD
ncbi:MAG: CBS domain-containing protein [Deltaproteobacteria bacterium]|jgi:IMP dehydrogenase|nr:CBS domain-containing protein [Deltaproteobacteria bacterium]